MNQPSRSWLSMAALAAVAVAVASVLWRVWLAGQADLAPDEAYYHAWSTRLAWTYLDHPPMTAWLLALMGAGPGDALGVRGLAIALTTGALAALAALVWRPATPMRSVGAVTLAVLTPAFGVGSVLLTPDAGLLLCWTLALLATVQLAGGGGWRPVALLAAAMAVGLLFKVTMGLMVLVVALGWAVGAFSPSQARRAGLALLTGCALAAPVYAAGLARGHILGFQAGRLSAAELRPLGALEAVGGWLGVAAPVVGAAGLALAVWGVLARARATSVERIVWASVAAPLGVFVALGTVVHGEANWSLVALPGAVCALVFLAERHPLGRPRWAWGTALGLGVAVLGAAVWMVARGAPAVGPDPLHEVHGWQTWAQEVAAVVDCEEPLVVTDRYQEASELRFYGGLEAWPLVSVEALGYAEPSGDAGPGRPTAFDRTWVDRPVSCVVLVTGGQVQPGPRVKGWRRRAVVALDRGPSSSVVTVLEAAGAGEAPGGGSP